MHGWLTKSFREITTDTVYLAIVALCCMLMECFMKILEELHTACKNVSDAARLSPELYI